jgi:hypothetical protein
MAANIEKKLLGTAVLFIQIPDDEPDVGHSIVLQH